MTLTDSIYKEKTVATGRQNKYIYGRDSTKPVESVISISIQQRNKRLDLYDRESRIVRKVDLV